MPQHCWCEAPEDCFICCYTGRTAPTWHSANNLSTPPDHRADALCWFVAVPPPHPSIFACDEHLLFVSLAGRGRFHGVGLSGADGKSWHDDVMLILAAAGICSISAQLKPRIIGPAIVCVPRTCSVGVKSHAMQEIQFHP